MPAIGGCTDPAPITGRVNILRPKNIMGTTSVVTRSVTPGRIGKDAITIRPDAAGARNDQPINGRGNMGIVLRCAETMIVIRRVLLFVDSMRVAGTGEMLTIGRP